MKPSRCLALIGWSARLSPPISIVPAVGCRIPAIILIVVVFPAPLGPRTPKSSPRDTSSVTSSTAVNEPERLVRWVSRIIRRKSGSRLHRGRVQNGQLGTPGQEHEVEGSGGSFDQQSEPRGICRHRAVLRVNRDPVPVE